ESRVQGIPGLVGIARARRGRALTIRGPQRSTRNPLNPQKVYGSASSASYALNVVKGDSGFTRCGASRQPAALVRLVAAPFVDEHRQATAPQDPDPCRL